MDKDKNKDKNIRPQLNHPEPETEIMNEYSPTEEEKLENMGFFPISEYISLYIIDKLISLSLTEVLRKETNRNIPKKCFTFITNFIKNFLKIEYLPHDRDDLYIKIQEDLLMKNFICQEDEIRDIKTENTNENKEKDLNSSGSPSDSIIDKESSKSITSNDSKLDDFINNQEKIKGEIYMDNYIRGINDWSIMSEPVGIFILLLNCSSFQN
jgi:hypothetical protein